RFQMRAQPGIVLEPPKCGRGKKQVLTTLRPQGLQVVDGRNTVFRIITGVAAIAAAWEMPGWPAIEIEEAIIAFAHDQNRGIAGQSAPHVGGETSRQPAVLPLACKHSSAKCALIACGSDGLETIMDELPDGSLGKVCLDIGSSQPAAAFGQFPIFKNQAH